MKWIPVIAKEENGKRYSTHINPELIESYGFEKQGSKWVVYVRMNSGDIQYPESFNEEDFLNDILYTK